MSGPAVLASASPPAAYIPLTLEDMGWLRRDSSCSLGASVLGGSILSLPSDSCWRGLGGSSGTSFGDTSASCSLDPPCEAPNKLRGSPEVSSNTSWAGSGWLLGGDRAPGARRLSGRRIEAEKPDVTELLSKRPARFAAGVLLEASAGPYPCPSPWLFLADAVLARARLKISD